jgi:hypothetical protein
MRKDRQMEFNWLIFCPAALMKNKDVLTLWFRVLNCSNIQPSLVNHYAKAEWSASSLATPFTWLALLFLVFNVKEEIPKNRTNPCNWLIFLNIQLDHIKVTKPCHIFR